MVVVARLKHLIDLAEIGHCIHVHMCHNRATGKSKVRIGCGKEPDVVPNALRCITVEAIKALMHCVSSLTVMDRGHRHSSGISESHFWLHGPQCEPMVEACSVKAGELNPLVEVGIQTQPHAQEGVAAAPRCDPQKLHVDWLQAVLDQHSYRVARAMRSIDSESLSDSEFQVYAFFKPAASGAWSPWSAADKVGVKSLIGGDILHSCVHHWFAEDLVYLIYADLDGVT